MFHENINTNLLTFLIAIQNAYLNIELYRCKNGEAKLKDITNGILTFTDADEIFEALDNIFALELKILIHNFKNSSNNHKAVLLEKLY
jgi:hypothetical protein